MMEFSYNDYINLLKKNALVFPKNFLPFFSLDRKKYHQLNELHKKKGISVISTLSSLRDRLSLDYFNKVYVAQSRALNFAEASFPSYKFIASEVITDDWLAIVDIHKKGCRDHTLHQPLTSYVVHKLLGGGIESNSIETPNGKLLTLCVEALLNKIKTSYLGDILMSLGGNHNYFKGENPSDRMIISSLFYETAMVAAIFHDIGYPQQYINRVSLNLENTGIIEDFSLLQSRDICNLFKNRLIMYPFHYYKAPNILSPTTWNDTLIALISKSLKKTHGFHGAMSFLYLNDIITEFPTNGNEHSILSKFCIEWASLAIMMHDMKSVYWGNSKTKPDNSFIRINFEVDPLSAIVAFADVIQDFERVDVNCLHENNHNIKYSYNTKSKKSFLSMNKNELTIQYKYTKDSNLSYETMNKFRDQWEYFDEDYGYLNLSYIGIDKVNLECKYDKI